MQLSKMSSRLVTAAAMVAAVACNNTNEGSASVKGAVNGKTLQAQSALFVSNAIQPVANANIIVGDANGTGPVLPAPGNMNNTNATLPLHAGTAGQSLMITISNQGDVCSQAGDSKQPANADYLVFSLTGAQAIAAGTYNITANAADVNTLLPGNLSPAQNANATPAAAGKRIVLADPTPTDGTTPAGDPNMGAPAGDPNTAPTGDANSVKPTDSSVVATASYLTGDAKCVATPVNAASGTVTLTKVDATGSVEGTFNVTMSSGENLTGNFKAQSCAPLLSTSAAPYSCN